MLTPYRVDTDDIFDDDPDSDWSTNYPRVYKEADILPLLREARQLVQMIYGTAEDHARAQRFLDATAAIEEEKGVEG